MLEKFYVNIRNVLNACTLLKYVKKTFKNRWYDNKMKDQYIKQKKDTYQKVIFTGIEEDWETYRKFRNKTMQLIKRK